MVRTKMMKLLACLAVICTFWSVIPTVAYAAEEAEATGRGQQIIDSGGAFAEVIAGMVNTADELDKNSVAVGLNDAILSSESGLRKIWDGVVNNGTLKKYYDIILSIGISLNFAYFLVFLMREMTEGHFNPDALIKSLIMLVAGIYLISNSFQLLLNFVDIGTSLGKSLLTAEAENPAAYLTVKDTWITEVAANKNVFTRVGALLAVLGSVGAAFVRRLPMLYIQVICYMRIIELFVRIVFSPLALGDIYSGGQNPTAIRYLRSFLACVLSGAVIVGANLIYHLILSAGLPELGGVSGFIAHCVILFALMGFCGKANTFAKELCGVG